ncbi:hypothetical protein TOT_040000509 [Theileria orientalis strain Shintoku]|uniref:Uncharacterized protein n=1 Tax=Theileria orientalis strain Shintoku TaxID=869250 RepID=J4DQB0_THEOR|nr:hypothetical protein TOT_040000509 [Theileria orientalis strain Shintoku]PVC54145.1 hypothetical protein MACL_00003287 [Theileria orientalis]BAM42139.1 hypothetical protein TOT_040000509 [Theileria orientalis strain Shintoku]|eukprot:XP_009692440.1 hypothetical protein TOT_040000509 [Theileria orientalis strain Shintoku]
MSTFRHSPLLLCSLAEIPTLIYLFTNIYAHTPCLYLPINYSRKI